MKTFTPYRICPLGAHVDHQWGKATGFAIDKGITMEFEPTEDGSIYVESCNFKGITRFNVRDEEIEKTNEWGDYLRGAVVSLSRYYELSKGLKGIVKGDLPIGGLSSSAAVIITYIVSLAKVNDIQLERSEVIKIALWVENSFVGIGVGKLDQSCEVLCKKGHLLYLDTIDDRYKLIPINENMKPFKVAIIFSGLERSLANSSYNLRVDECKAAAYELKGLANMEYGKFNDTRLRDVPREIFEEYKSYLPVNWYRRALHFYDENERVMLGVQAWKDGDLDKFGKLIFESGYSSIYNYETGSEELRALYEIMTNTDGIYGGRFSGAGFKGFCMALIDPEKEESIKENITQEYLNRFPLLKDRFSIHICEISNGVELK